MDVRMDLLTLYALRISPYKILFHFKALLEESIIILSPPNTCKAYPIAILLHAHCAIYAPPPTSLFYAIHHTISVMAISCKGQPPDHLRPLPSDRYIDRQPRPSRTQNIHLSLCAWLCLCALLYIDWDLFMNWFTDYMHPPDHVRPLPGDRYVDRR